MSRIAPIWLFPATSLILAAGAACDPQPDTDTANRANRTRVAHGESGGRESTEATRVGKEPGKEPTRVGAEAEQQKRGPSSPVGLTGEIPKPTAAHRPVVMTDPGRGDEREPLVRPLACARDEFWAAQSIEGLSRLDVLAPGEQLPRPRWRPCVDRDHCRLLFLQSRQRLLAIGQRGNQVDLAIAEGCESSGSLLVGAPDEPARLAIRGYGLEFLEAALGGDRTLAAAERVVDRGGQKGKVDYLITAREGAYEELRVVPNPLDARPVAAAHQLVQVEAGSKLCTTVFWKLGLGRCDFPGPASSGSVLLGGHLIYPSRGRGMTWSPKRGSRQLLSALDWIVTDGVNVAWSEQGRLHWQQPDWQLQELEAHAMPGEPGPRPVAMGCGRLLARTERGWVLRDVKKGTQWLYDDGRFPDPFGSWGAMDCGSVVFDGGYRIDFARPPHRPEPVPSAVAHHAPRPQ